MFFVDARRSSDVDRRRQPRFQFWCYDRFFRASRLSRPVVFSGHPVRSDFSADAVKDFKKRHSKRSLVCLICRGRLKQIDTRIKARDSWRCTCPNSKGGKHHNAGNEKCQLYPRRAGEQRWPGKNHRTPVTKDEYDLWRRLQFWDA